MSMTREAEKWHEIYEDLDAATMCTIDEAYRAARKVLLSICPASNDDRAEELIAAITKYYKESLT